MFAQRQMLLHDQIDLCFMNVKTCKNVAEKGKSKLFAFPHCFAKMNDLDILTCKLGSFLVSKISESPLGLMVFWRLFHGKKLVWYQICKSPKSRAIETGVCAFKGAENCSWAKKTFFRRQNLTNCCFFSTFPKILFQQIFERRSRRWLLPKMKVSRNLEFAATFPFRIAQIFRQIKP